MRLSTDGDPFERHYWASFVAQSFPSYEAFWLDFVVPLTGRDADPPHLHFRADATDGDVTVAQLHYTTLMHLGRVHNAIESWEPPQTWRAPRALPGPGSAVLDTRPAAARSASATSSYTGAEFGHGDSVVRNVEPDELIEAFVRLSAVSDVADELLERRLHPSAYEPWSERQGKNARWAWRNAHGDPLKPIRGYRNRLVHGRVVPRLLGLSGAPRYPRLDKIDCYLDWRKATGPDPVLLADFDDGRTLVFDAWRQTIGYCEAQWRTHLLGGPEAATS